MGGGEPLEEFRRAGRTLFSFGLVKGAEGNLSTFDGDVLVITRTGSRLDGLDVGDLIVGPIDGDLPGASSDLEVHRRIYAEQGPGAVAHCHPPGTAEEGTAPGEHGDYTLAGTLDEAVAEAVARERRRGGR
jgi:ribulose-5-phosphate 4-epimerase/fuculose-1-phosphate aldolase